MRTIYLETANFKQSRDVVRPDRLSRLLDAAHARGIAVVAWYLPSFRAGGFGTALGAFQIEEGESATQIVATISDAESSFVAKVGDATPDFKMAFVNDISIGAFNIYSLFDWQAGGAVVNLTKLLYDFGQNTWDFEDDPQNVVNIGPVCAVELADGSCDPAGDELTLGEPVLFRAAQALESELAFDPVPRGANALHPPAAPTTKKER